MVFKKINITKCPRCHSSNKTRLNEGFYHCNQCSSNYYGNADYNDGLLVKSHRTLQDQSSKRKSLYIKIIIGVFVIYFIAAIVNILNDRYQSNTDENIGSEYSSINQLEKGQDDILTNSELGTKETESITINFYPRTAYVLYKDYQNQQALLFKASFLTQNTDPDDSKAIIIKEEKGSFVGYDAVNDKAIPNFKQLASTPFSFDAAILYSDKNDLIVKNRISNNYQLEMLDSYTGNVIWTLSAKELSGIDKLNGKFSSETNEGIELFRDNFKIKLPPNYYVVDKKGQIIGFGKIN